MIGVIGPIGVMGRIRPIGLIGPIRRWDDGDVSHLRRSGGGGCFDL